MKESVGTLLTEYNMSSFKEFLEFVSVNAKINPINTYNIAQKFLYMPKNPYDSFFGQKLALHREIISVLV